MPREVFGFPFKGIGIPIRYESGKVIGSLGVGKSLKRQGEISDLADTLSSSLEQIAIAIDEISSGVQAVSTFNSSVSKNIDDTQVETEKTDYIIKFVNNVASKTNLLGLNASIEAARAGEHGRGFAVVAEEIRKLSTTTTTSIKEINGILKNVRNSVDDIKENMYESNSVFQEQAAALEEVTASMQELYSSAEILRTISSEF